MSLEASMEIQFYGYNDIGGVIKSFLKAGWRLTNEVGKTSYLAIGGKDDFDWREEIIAEDEFFKIVELKEQYNEVIGIVMYWKNTNIGITLLSRLANQSILTFDINRKKTNEKDIHSVTDINWYVDKIIVNLRQNNCLIERYKFEEY